MFPLPTEQAHVPFLPAPPVLYQQLWLAWHRSLQQDLQQRNHWQTWCPVRTMAGMQGFLSEYCAFLEHMFPLPSLLEETPVSTDDRQSTEEKGGKQAAKHEQKEKRKLKRKRKRKQKQPPVQVNNRKVTKKAKIYISIESSIFPSVKKDYVRKRNSRLGVKYLSCFPNCGRIHASEVHCYGSKCAVQVIFNMPVHHQISDIHACARFELNGMGLSPPEIPPEESELLSKESPTARWVSVRIRKGKNLASLEFILNEANLPWHYGWKATKWAGNHLHRLKLYVYCKKPYEGEEAFQYVGSVASTSFRIQSDERLQESLLARFNID